MRNLTFAMVLAFGWLTLHSQVSSPTSILKDLSVERMSQIERGTNEKRDSKCPERIVNHRQATQSLVVERPSFDEPLIDSTPEGEMFVYQKSGAYFSYNWLMGMTGGSLDGTVSRVVFSPDGSKLYMQSPVSFFFDCKNNWIVGDIIDDKVTFTFPQMISYVRYEYSPDEVVEYYDYALKLEYIESEDGESGWYYPTENQEMTFNILADGSLEPVDSDLSMIGECVWFDQGDNASDEGGYWSWQGNGDIITQMKKVTDEAIEVPSEVEFETWSLISGLSTSDVQIGIMDDQLYFKGLFSYLPDATVVGTIEDNKVIFKGGQYLGVAWDYLSTAYFLTGDMIQIDSENGSYPFFVVEDDLTFEYDSQKKILSCPNGTYLFSSVPDQVIYYSYVENPYLCVPDPNAEIKSLLAPIITEFFDYQDFESYELFPEIRFDFPTVDADKQPLDKSKLFYQVMVDGEPFEFDGDEYELPNGESSTTEIPFGYRSNAFWITSNIGHGVVLYFLGFESLGIRTFYKDGDTLIYSDIAEVDGYNRLNQVEEGKDILSINYYNLTGQKVTRPSEGVVLRQTVFSNGSKKVEKLVIR